MLKSPPQVVSSVQVDSFTDPKPVALPTDPSGNPVSFVMVTHTSSNVVIVGFGDSTVNGANGDELAGITLSHVEPLIFNVSGMTHMSWGSGSGQIIIAALAE